jgi:hypothetical protein
VPLGRVPETHIDDEAGLAPEEIPDAHADASLHSDDLEQRVVGVSHLPEGDHLVRIDGRRRLLQVLRH